MTDVDHASTLLLSLKHAIRCLVCERFETSHSFAIIAIAAVQQNDRLAQIGPDPRIIRSKNVWMLS